MLHENVPFPLPATRRHSNRRARHRQKLNIAELSKATAVRSGAGAVSCCRPSNAAGSHMPVDLTAVAPSVSAVLTVSGPSPADLTGKCELRLTSHQSSEKQRLQRHGPSRELQTSTYHKLLYNF